MLQRGVVLPALSWLCLLAYMCGSVCMRVATRCVLVELVSLGLLAFGFCVLNTFLIIAYLRRQQGQTVAGRDRGTEPR